MRSLTECYSWRACSCSSHCSSKCSSSTEMGFSSHTIWFQFFQFIFLCFWLFIAGAHVMFHLYIHNSITLRTIINIVDCVLCPMSLILAAGPSGSKLMGSELQSLVWALASEALCSNLRSPDESLASATCNAFWWWWGWWHGNSFVQKEIHRQGLLPVIARVMGE